ncbi:hypothetical protein SAMN04487948_10913 [Halogranum amylolyticum]|uniref:Uncharacterized protein n=1 Tax=Halogranum amylolyticum TaxID=660520 RepID=A0A1H8U042_9EURY|nr:hypothetical protein SAMN04487948_10913 [Halogranum amylolyticum]
MTQTWHFGKDNEKRENSTRDPANCRYCGSHVGQKFRKVFGDNSDIAWACKSCLTDDLPVNYRDSIRKGACADPEKRDQMILDAQSGVDATQNTENSEVEA